MLQPTDLSEKWNIWLTVQLTTYKISSLDHKFKKIDSMANEIREQSRNFKVDTFLSYLSYLRHYQTLPGPDPAGPENQPGRFQRPSLPDIKRWEHDTHKY